MADFLPNDIEILVKNLDKIIVKQHCNMSTWRGSVSISKSVLSLQGQGV